MTRRSKSTLLLLLVLTAACGDDSTEGEAAGDTGDEVISTVEYMAFRNQDVACGGEVPIPARALAFTQPQDLGLSGPVTAIVHTSCGEITMTLDPSVAPATVNSFVFLAEQGYFDGTVSHRIVRGFMVQAGDPTATGRGGPGYFLPDELPQTGFLYTRGTVAMANAGANTGGSQFFMMLADAPLPPAYSVFGTIVEGIDVLDRIAEVPTVARQAGQEPSSPLETVFIERIEIQR